MIFKLLNNEKEGTVSPGIGYVVDHLHAIYAQALSDYRSKHKFMLSLCLVKTTAKCWTGVIFGHLS